MGITLSVFLILIQQVTLRPAVVCKKPVGGAAPGVPDESQTVKVGLTLHAFGEVKDILALTFLLRDFA